MKERTILCWGDSNTYGFDPRGFFGGRLGPEERWCGLLAAETGARVVNCGENGRTTPLHSWEAGALLDALAANRPVSLLILMLGTNDILMGYQDVLRQAAAHMELLAQLVKESFPDTELLLLAPPPISLPEPELKRQLPELAGLYRQAAERQGIFFCDPGRWELPLAFDGVHLSAAGHRAFARELLAELKEDGLLP